MSHIGWALRFTRRRASARVIHVRSGCVRTSRPPRRLSPHPVPSSAVVVELGIGLCLIAGLLPRAAALVLAAYTLVLGLIFHAYWLGPAAEARFNRIIFYNHLSIIAGMLVAVVFAAGCWSLNALMQRRSERTPDAIRHAVAHR